VRGRGNWGNGIDGSLGGSDILSMYKKNLYSVIVLGEQLVSRRGGGAVRTGRRFGGPSHKEGMTYVVRAGNFFPDEKGFTGWKTMRKGLPNQLC